MEPTIYNTMSIPGHNVDELRHRMNSFLDDQLAVVDATRFSGSAGPMAITPDDASASDTGELSESSSTNLSPRSKDSDRSEKVVSLSPRRPPVLRSLKGSISSFSEFFGKSKGKEKEKESAEPSSPIRPVERYNFLLYGDVGTGRTSLMNRMAQNFFTPVARSKEDERASDLSIGGAKVTLLNPLVRPETPLDAVSQISLGWFDGIFLVYDVTVRESLKHIALQVEVLIFIRLCRCFSFS